MQLFPLANISNWKISHFPKSPLNPIIYHQIEALLKRINDENKKTKEVLDKIDRGEFKKEKRVDTYHHRKEDDEGDEEEDEEDEGTSSNNVAPPPEATSKSRVSFSGSWATDKAEDITWATSMEQKR